MKLSMAFQQKDSLKKTSSAKSCFPVINGEVHVFVKNQNDRVVLDQTLKVYPKLRILDAFENEKGRFHALTGQRQEFLVKNIFKDVYKREFSNARKATVIFLAQIQEAYEAGEKYVNTIFGLKFLDMEKDILQPETDCDF